MSEPQVTLTLPLGPLERLAAVWRAGAPDSQIIAAVRDIFNGFDGELHALTDVLAARREQHQRAFNDPVVPCCVRDAADCDCPPLQVKYAAVAEATGFPAGLVATVDRIRHSARPFAHADHDHIARALDSYEKENRHA